MLQESSGMVTDCPVFGARAKGMEPSLCPYLSQERGVCCP